MRRAGPVGCVLLSLLATGCLGGPQLAFEGVFAQSDASHDGTAYHVNLRGRVLNQAPEPAVWVRVFAAVGADCLTDPKDWPGFVDLGNIAPGSSAPVRHGFDQPGVRFEASTLWWRITHTDRSAPVDKGCAPLRVG